MYQIKKFLNHLKVDWANEIKLPKNPVYSPKRVSNSDIRNILLFFQKNPHFLQAKALVLLGIASGLRPEELYQLNPKDIDLKNRIVRVNHNPQNGQTTKTKHSRVSFFNKETLSTLEEYLSFFNNGCAYSQLFPQTTITRLFNKAPIRVKHLRKYFSQEWDRRGGPTSIKKIIMGHSRKGDVDLMHYNYQSEGDLKKIYDRVMNDNIL
jgi:integrase/recombinase XerD